MLKTLIDTLKTLIILKRPLLLAIAASSLLCIMLLLCIYAGTVDFSNISRIYLPPLLILFSFCFVIALSMLHEETHIRTVEIFPYGHECWAHVAVQKDGRKTTQIVCNVNVFNITNEKIWLPKISLVMPKVNGPLLSKMFTVREQISNYHGDFEIPPQGKTDGSGCIIVNADISDEIAKYGVILKIADQYNHWHTLKFFNVKIT